MKQEIKQRIDKIRLGEVPEGYKKLIIENDKSVIIPKDWDDKNTAGDVFDFYGSLSASREQLSDNGYCYLHYGDIHKSNKCAINVEKEIDIIPKLDIELSRVSKTSMLCDGDIVFVDASEDYEGASKHIVIENPKNIPFIAGLHTIVGKSKNSKLNNGYKKYCFQSNLVKNQFCFYLTGIKVYGLSKSNIQKIKFPLPHITEQEKIAEILTTWDEAIELIEKYIKALETRKNVLMGLLLSPNSNGKFEIGDVLIDKSKWEKKKLNEITIFQEGPGVRNTQYTKEGVKLLNVGNFKNNNLDLTATDKYISHEEANGSYKHFLIDENDLLIACSGIKADYFSEKVAIARIEHLPLCMNTSTMRFKSKDANKLDINYLFCFLQSNYFVMQIKGILTGSAQFNFGPTHLKYLNVLVPTIEEQTAIVNILLITGQEIELHKQEFEKLKLQKQSLMQLLLTGIVRVS